jgi:hypothetical protein
MRVWLKCGIVDMSGERAHGLVGDIRSCSRVGSMKLHDCRGYVLVSGGLEGQGTETYCINLRAALVPHGSFSGLSNVFPKRMSSAEYVFKNRPTRPS